MFNTNSAFNVYNQTVTLLNKIPGEQLGQKEDKWIKTVLTGAVWTVKPQAFVSGTSISYQNTQQVFLTDVSNYLPFREFIAYGGNSNNWTLSLNDYVVRGEVFDDLNSTSITKVLSKYRPCVCKVQTFKELPARGFNMIKFVIEGV
jgi:hypothetical protein